ncbi:MAG: AAA family ATPase, partial [Rhodospirillaceae bacterium]
MIAKGLRFPAGGGARERLAHHLTKSISEDHKEQTVEIGDMHAVSGLGDSNFERVYHALAEHEASLAGTKVQKPIWHGHIDPDRPLTPEQRVRAREIYEECLGLKGHAFLEVIHDKQGRFSHAHYVWSTRDPRTGRNVDIDWSIYKDEMASRTMEFEFGHPYTPMKAGHAQQVAARLREMGRHDVADWVIAEAKTKVASAAVLTHAEQQRQLRTGIKEVETRAEIAAAFDAASTGADFRAAIEAKGYILAYDPARRKLAVVDKAGTDHKIDRAISADRKRQKLPEIPKSELNARIAAKLADITIADLPSPAAAKSRQNARYPEFDPSKKAAKARKTADRKADAALGGTGPAVGAALPGSPPPPKKALPTDPIALATSDRCVFTDRQLRAACRRIANGDPTLAAALYRQALSSPELVALKPTLPGPLTVPAAASPFADGVRPKTDPGPFYTSRTLLIAETDLLTLARDAKNNASHQIPVAVAEKILEEYRIAFRASHGGSDLRDEQITGVYALTTGSASIVNLVGVAGSGKSTSLEAANRIWTTCGYNVSGIALAGKAAVNIAESGIPASTIAKWQAKFDKAQAYRTGNLDATWITGVPPREVSVRDSLVATLEYARSRAQSPQQKENFALGIAALKAAPTAAQLPPAVKAFFARQIEKRTRELPNSKSIVVLDEAGMVGVAQLAGVVRRLHSVGAKLATVGDHEQLQSIEPGAPFRLLLAELGAAELTTVARQKTAWQATATEQFSQGNADAAEAALRAYADGGCVHVGFGGDYLSETTRAAEQALGRPLTEEDKSRIAMVAQYVASRQEAGAIWHGGLKDADPKSAHPDYAAFQAAQKARGEAARSIETDIDGCRNWLARYGVKPTDFTADLLAARGTFRDAAKSQAAALAARLGLLSHTPDCSLSVDFRHAARSGLITAWSADEAKDWADYTSKLAAYHAASPPVGDAPKPPSSLILAFTRDDVKALNAAARAEMRKMGRLGEEVTVKTADRGDLQFAPGDRLQCLANAQGQPLQNGLFGSIISISQETEKSGALKPPVLLVQFDGQPNPVQVDTATYKSLDYGYSATVHKSQGATVNRVQVLASKFFDRHLYYVALSRHRLSAHIWGASSDFPDLDSLVKSVRQARSADAISDYIDPLSVQIQTAADTTPTAAAEATADVKSKGSIRVRRTSPFMVESIS